MITETMHICVYKEIHKKLRRIAYEKNTSITKVASNLLKEALELKDEGGDNGK